ncbi:MAG: WYL domain-containing protein [Ruminococcus sp.]|nr:WYL domain-containing protein [Ruminococcus sp.]
MHDYDEEYIKNFRLLARAVHEHRKINFNNINAQGQKYINNERFPFRIEYSVTMRNFRLSLWNKKEERPFKANISRISDIELLDVISDEEYKSVMNMMEQKKEKHPIIMTVTNENNAIERINLLFSMYHKNTEFISADKIQISLSYYNFDEDEIIRNIMSFGKFVHVLSPERVVNKIKEKLLS